MTTVTPDPMDGFDALTICGATLGDHCWHAAQWILAAPDGSPHRWNVCCQCGLLQTRPIIYGADQDSPQNPRGAHGEYAGKLISAVFNLFQSVAIEPFGTPDPGSFEQAQIETLDSATDLIAELISQACTTSAGELDSSGISTYADALRFLAGAGRVEIVREYGRRVIAIHKDTTQ